MSDFDAAVPLENLVPGYPKLSGQMEVLAEISIFRRFGALNAQNLLYYQAELTSLEKDLRTCEKNNNDSTHENHKMYAKDWYYLNRCADFDDEPEGRKQLDLVHKIRKCLEDYNKALFYQSAILNLNEPSRYDINDIQHYLASEDMGPLALSGFDCNVWGTITEPYLHAPDLIGLRGRKKTDLFSRWVTNSGVLWLFRCGLHRFKKPSKVHGIVSFADKTLLRITSWVSTVVASLLPVISIAILYVTDSVKDRLVIVGCFNLALSICLSIFTTAGRSEIFAVSAAFSAVQVVFIAVNDQR